MVWCSIEISHIFSCYLHGTLANLIDQNSFNDMLACTNRIRVTVDRSVPQKLWHYVKRVSVGKKSSCFFLSCSKWPFLHSFPRIYEKFKEDVSYHVFWVNVVEINEPVSKKFIGSSRYLSVRACQRRTRKSQKLTHAQNMHYCIYL